MVISGPEEVATPYERAKNLQLGLEVIDMSVLPCRRWQRSPLILAIEVRKEVLKGTYQLSMLVERRRQLKK
jgi:hypothetical protein